MLAKQCWRLLSEPESLCAQVLCAKYYPDGDLSNAVLKKGSSFTWGSIMAGLKTLKRGAIWRPGNGASINIWSDLWIPTPYDRRVMTPRGHCLLETVKDLIDPHTGEWDVQCLAN